MSGFLFALAIAQSAAGHTLDEAFVTPPRTFQSKLAMKKWVRGHQGFSGDNIAVRELAYNGDKLYVTWVHPFSGVNGQRVWTYRQTKEDPVKWRFLDADTFYYPKLLGEVEVVSRKGKLVFIDFRGKIVKSLKL